MNSYLQIRLKNCLQTILDVELDLERYPLFETLKPEMETLKKYLSDIDSLELSEDDVARLEHATTLFLDEIYLPVGEKIDADAKKRVLQ